MDWDIPDAFGMEPEAAREVFYQVKQHVQELVAQIGSTATGTPCNRTNEKGILAAIDPGRCR